MTDTTSKRLAKLLAAAAMLAVCAACAAQNPKYIFFFIGDGMSVPQRMAAEEFSRKIEGRGLAINAMPVQAMLRTCPVDSLVTDSAAAATALACGVKTLNGAIGTDRHGAGVESCASAARKSGRKTGIITNTTLSHATPACFFAHCKHRGQYYDIAVDLAKSGFDFFAGGGLPDHGKTNETHWTEYGDAIKLAEANGYKVVRTKNDFLALAPGCGKTLSMFSKSHMEHSLDMDRERQPTLAEMLKKAIELLDNPDGFFIMLEGGQIDFAGHGNDIGTNMRDMLAFDETVRVAQEFLEAHPGETLIAVTGDHETGGLSLGCTGAGYNFFIERVAGQTTGVDRFSNESRHMMRKRLEKGETPEFKETRDLVAKAFGFKFEGDPEKDPLVLSKSEYERIKSAFENDVEYTRSKVAETKAHDAVRKYLLASTCRSILAEKAGVSWGSAHHTALPVMATLQGAGAENFAGYMENDEFGRRMKELCAR